MSLRVLIIGYGSIGKRHAQVMEQYFSCAVCTLISSQNLPNAYPTLDALPDINAFDYYIIASPTSTHLEYLRTLDTQLENKTIFVEKPLFDKDYPFVPSRKNTIFVGFCLRFHPLLWYARKKLANNPAYFASISCGSYLPSWRAGVDYRTIYSAHKSQGGGVLLDLSHELDYTEWLFGALITESIVGFNGKISELSISSDDTLAFVAKSTQGTLIQLTLDYFSKAPRRVVRIHTEAFELELDLIQNRITETASQGHYEQKSYTFERNEMFALMHQSVLHSPSFKGDQISQALRDIKQTEILPTLEEAMPLMHTITRIKNMKPHQNILCVIGCRGGSKGVKNKNITPLAGKPLIAHTIIQALQSKLFDHIVLSTDSEQIAKVGQEWGAEVFFLREKELASDNAGKLPVIRDALLRSEKHYNKRFDVVFDLDATSPLRLVSDITEAYHQFVRDDNDILITAAPARKSPYFNLIEVFEKNGTPYVDLSKRPKEPILRRQDSPKCYDMNASIYIWKREALLENDSVFVPNTGLFVMPEERSVDIDTPLDFMFVEFMLTKTNNMAMGGGHKLNYCPILSSFQQFDDTNSLAIDSALYPASLAHKACLTEPKHILDILQSEHISSYTHKVA